MQQAVFLSLGSQEVEKRGLCVEWEVCFGGEKIGLHTERERCACWQACRAEPGRETKQKGRQVKANKNKSESQTGEAKARTPD